jgi:hypothetical protein
VCLLHRLLRLLDEQIVEDARCGKEGVQSRLSLGLSGDGGVCCVGVSNSKKTCSKNKNTRKNQFVYF